MSYFLAALEFIFEVYYIFTECVVVYDACDMS
jgi:hypothetical protein